MQNYAMNIAWAVAISTAVLLFLATAIILIVIRSKRKEIEAKARQLEELTRSEQKYRSLFENSLAGIIKFSLESWEILDSNKAVKNIFNCTTEEELARCFSSLPVRNIQDIQRTLLSNDVIQEYEIGTTRPDGKELWILFSARMTGEGNFAHGVIIDVTEHKLAHEKVLEQALLLDEAQDAIMVADFGGRLTFWNNGAEHIYGYNRKEAVGSMLRDLLFDSTHQKDYDLAMEDILQFNEWSGEHLHLNKSGKELRIHGRWKKVENTSTNKKVILIVNTDITEKKRQEQQLLRARRMESIALLTGGIAHDLQNVLAPVSMSIDLLREKLTDNKSAKVLDAVEESARSGLELVRNIITYGHGIPGQREKVDLHDLIDSVLVIVRQTIPEAIKVERMVKCDNCIVLGDANQLKQVFLNIIVNARDAMPNGGTLSISIDKTAIDSDNIDQHPETKPGVYYVIKIRDSGVGIAEDLIERIFEPFYTTKQSGNGTGLGLSIAMGIVKSHSGSITVQSSLNKGTEFNIYLQALDPGISKDQS